MEEVDGATTTAVEVGVVVEDDPDASSALSNDEGTDATVVVAPALTSSEESKAVSNASTSAKDQHDEEGLQVSRISWHDAPPMTSGSSNSD